MISLYISGPIQGIARSTAKRNFREAAARLSQAGFAVMDPFDLDPLCAEGARHLRPEQHEWECWVRGDLGPMLRCDGLAMLPGWERSRGAKLEQFVALQVGLRVRELEAWFA